MDIIQPYITGVAQAILGLLATVVIGFILLQKKRFDKWMESKTTVSQRDSIHKFSLEAFAFAESIFKQSNGPEKFQVAYTYLLNRLKEHGINISEDEIKAIIEKSVIDANATTKSINTTIITKGVDPDASKESK
jgi:DNA polymerase III delta prime subunit